MSIPLFFALAWTNLQAAFLAVVSFVFYQDGTPMANIVACGIAALLLLHVQFVFFRAFFVDMEKRINERMTKQRPLIGGQQ